MFPPASHVSALVATILAALDSSVHILYSGEQTSSMTNPSSSPLRAGLIGYGYAGKTFHAPLLRAVPGLELTVVGSSRPGSRTRRHSRCHDSARRWRLRRILSSTCRHRNSQRQPLSSRRRGAEGGQARRRRQALHRSTSPKHASWCSWPVEQNRLLSVFQNRRWESDILAAKSILASGVLGKVMHFEAHMDRFRPLVRQRWREDPGPGAGLWFDLGPHLIDLTLASLRSARLRARQHRNAAPGRQD